MGYRPVVSYRILENSRENLMEKSFSQKSMHFFSSKCVKIHTSTFGAVLKVGWQHRFVPHPPNGSKHRQE